MPWLAIAHLVKGRADVPVISLQLLAPCALPQFLHADFCGIPAHRAPARWVFASGSADRHDQAHLLSHHVQMPLPTLASALSAVSVRARILPLACKPLPHQLVVTCPPAYRLQASVRAAPGNEYGRLLHVLDDAAAREVDAALESIPALTEPHVARELSRVLPTGVTSHPAQPLCPPVINAATLRSAD